MNHMGLDRPHLRPPSGGSLKSPPSYEYIAHECPIKAVPEIFHSSLVGKIH